MTTHTPMNLGLLVHRSRRSASTVARQLESLASERGHTSTWLGADNGTANVAEAADVDVVVGIGGDGTLLEAARIAHGVDRPVVGVNLGTVGYLTEFEPDQLEQLLVTLSDANPPTIDRMTVVATTADGQSWHALNDVVLEKVVSQRIVRIGVEIDGHHFTTYRADGIIVATPLGSTAYSLSAGGPVVAPELEALLLTPVAPHSLLSRSLVLSPHTRILFTVEADREVRVNFDGREACTLAEGQTLVVERGDRPVRFISPGIHPFPQGVRKQFGLDHA